jgi:hypothetical protein
MLMPLSSIVTNFYYENQSPAISAELSELSVGYAQYPPPGISAELSELLDSIPTQGISAEMQGRIPELLILLGRDTTSGQYKTFSPGDSLVKTNNSLYLGGTGIRGFTGLAGVTGLPGLQGETGLFTGATGLRGITGTLLNGRTGLLGETGAAGLTGLRPTQGATGAGVTGLGGPAGFQVSGVTGLQGLTGLVGITGLGTTGIVGLQGNTGIEGATGIYGAIISVQGATGISIGETGLAGATGSVGIGGVETVITLVASNSTTASSISYTVPANTLDTNEQQLEIMAWGVSSSAGVDTTVSLTLGGSTILSQSINGEGGSTFFLRSLIIRITGSSQENNSYLISRDGGTLAQRTATAVDLTVSQTLQVSVSAVEGQQFVFGLLARKVSQV